MRTLIPTNTFKVGDCVVYRKTKHSTHPGPRARSINPNPNGDEYTYLVDKYWVVEDVLSDEQGGSEDSSRQTTHNFSRFSQPSKSQHLGAFLAQVSF